MRRVFSAATLLMLACAACDASPGAGGQTPDGGRILVQRVARRTATLLSGPARATYCSGDSLLLITAIGRAWTSAFAVRVGLPLLATHTFQVRRSLGGPGTATAAFRPLLKGAAQLTTGGTLSLEPSTTISGRFDVAAPDSGLLHVSFRGRWSRVPLYQLPKNSCAAG